MEDLFGTLTELGIGGAIVGMFYLFTLRFERQLEKQRILHEEEREKQELRHAAERKEWRKTVENFEHTMAEFNKTLMEMRIEFAKGK